MAAVWCVLVGVMSVLLQLAGFVSPGWFRLTVVDIGLWYICFMGGCISHMSIAELASGNPAASWAYSVAWLEFQIEATIGVMAGICSLVLTCVFCKKNTVQCKPIMIVAAVASVVSGVLSWVPAGKFLQSYSALAILITAEFPYSALLTGMGASLALLNAILIFILICRANQTVQMGHVVQSDYQMQHVAHTQVSGYPTQSYANAGFVENQYAHRKY